MGYTRGWGEKGGGGSLGAGWLFMVVLLLPLLAVEVAVAVAGQRGEQRSGTGCVSALGCGLNGECVAGTCRCDPGWRGDVCGELDLQPVDKAVRGLFLQAENSSTWGGTPVRDPHDARLFHLFAEYMAENCPLTDWANNSKIVHATASSPLGPFEVRSVAFAPFRHNVGAAHHNGTWWMFQTGCEVWEDTLPNCTTGSASLRSAGARPPLPPGCTGLIRPPPATAKLYAAYSLSGRVRLAHAPSPDGDDTITCLLPRRAAFSLSDGLVLLRRAVDLAAAPRAAAAARWRRVVGRLHHQRRAGARAGGRLCAACLPR